jgi:hypothetical protein
METEKLEHRIDVLADLAPERATLRRGCLKHPGSIALQRGEGRLRPA